MEEEEKKFYFWFIKNKFKPYEETEKRKTTKTEA